LIGRTLAHYRITAAIGAGGMGEVYRATDTRLGRDVALKVLPAEMAASPEMLERFRREARAVAALNHPHIVTIFSVEEADGVHFLTMELVEGQSLDRLIPADGLPVERILAIATALSEALAAAHEKGIVHRDLKPANVMVTDGGGVKVLDFGLAKDLRPVGETAATVTSAGHTEPGVVMGTRHYMSPEQVQARPLDHRTDIFSLGVVLYEMTTGRRPFRGESSADLFASILRDDPEPALSDVTPDLPRHLGRIIERCLEKAPIDRYQVARDVYNELRALRKETTGAAAPPRPSAHSDSALRRSQMEAPWIAVMPLQCQTADPDLESFADGLTDDITTSLSRFSYLLVISRNSTRKLEGRSMDVRQVGQELGARFVLEGAVRKGGSKIRASVRVVDARTGTHLWAETFDRNLHETDIFEVQDEITDRVASTVADPYGVLIRSMAAPTASKPVEALTPYEGVLRFFLYQQSVAPADHLVARRALERAVELEPDYADAWACLTICLLDEFRHAFNPRPNPLERALDAAQRAVAIDPANQLANFALAQVHHFRRDAGAFRAAADRAISLNRRDGNTMAMLGILMGYGGDWERAVELTTRAMALNPHHPGWYHFTTFFNAYRQRRDADALAVVQKINMPGYFSTHYCTAIAHAQLGNLAAARAAAQRTVELWPDFERDFVSDHIEKWIHKQPELVDRVIEGLELAGLHVRRPDRGGAARASAPELATEAPRAPAGVPPATGRDAESRPRPRGNLPSSVDSFVAREEELSEVAALLADMRLVTVTGAGGTGKTRLALEVANRMTAGFTDGAWLVELAPVAQAEAVPFVVADLLGIVQQPGKTMAQSVVDALRHRSLLLVLDNCEHVLAAAADLAAAITTQCAGSRILATSRERLATRGEHVMRLEVLDDNAGAQLFRDRASASGARGDLDMGTLARLSRRLDGMPLAIELAAARAASMRPEDIEQRLNDRFRLLRGRGRGVAERQQTLYNTVAWSFDLLEKSEQEVFARLSVFAGAFSLEAACAVAGGRDADARDVEDAIAALVSRSMVLAADAGEGTRYRMLETLRQFGSEQLVTSGSATDVRQRHVRFFADFMTKAWTGLWGPDDPRWIRAVDRDFENLRAAVFAAIDDQDREALAALLKPHHFWAWHALRYEVGDWAEAALAVRPEPAFARPVSVHLRFHGGRHDDANRLAAGLRDPGKEGDPDLACLTAMAHWDRALAAGGAGFEPWMLRTGEAGRRTGNAALAATLESIQVAFNAMSGRMDEARRIAVRTHDEARATSNQAALCWTSFFMGRAFSDTDPGRALEHLDRSIEIAARCGIPLVGGLAATEAAVVIAHHEEPGRAVARLSRAVRAFLDSGDRWQLWTSAHHLAYFLTRVGRLDDARRLWQQLGSRQAYAAQHHRDELAHLLGPMGESAMSDDELVDAIRAVLDALDRQEPASPGPAPAAQAEVPSASPSGATRADEGFWIAVLPFKYTGADADIATLAEGLSEEIVTGLSRFSYLRVIARSSIAHHAGEPPNVGGVGQEPRGRYVMEGSLRRAGSQLRVGVQLVDTSSGTHLWAETYDRAFAPEDGFALQDELVPRIVSTVADMQGVLARSMSEAVRSRPPDQLSPYEAVLRSFGYFERLTGEELAAARAGLEAALQTAPTYADAWAMLALLCAKGSSFTPIRWNVD
jgi:TolB-like protein/predicted ATPase